MKKILRLLVEGRIGKVDIFLVEPLFCQLNCLAEVSNLSKSPGAQCLQGVQVFFSGLKNVRIIPHLGNLDVAELLSGNPV